MFKRPILIILSIIISSCVTSNSRKERAQLLLQRGLSNFQNGNLPFALKDLLEAEKEDNTNPLIQNNLGLIYFEREKYGLSEKHLLRAISLKEDYTDARNNLGRVYIEETKYKEAEKELNLVLNDLTYSKMDKAYLFYGLSKFNQGLFKDSLFYFTKSVDSNKENCPALSYLGRAYFELKNYMRASEILEKAVAYCQKILFDEPHYFSALTFYRLGDKRKSVAKFNEVVKLYPNGLYRDKSKAMLDLISNELGER